MIRKLASKQFREIKYRKISIRELLVRKTGQGLIAAAKRKLQHQFGGKDELKNRNVSRVY